MAQGTLPRKRRYNIRLKRILSFFVFICEILLRRSAVKGADLLQA